MHNEKDVAKHLGDDDPLLADGRKAPDRREVSIRWLSGTFLTGITSSALMGIALFAALDGREQLAIPGEAFASTEITGKAIQSDGAEKGGRLVATAIAAKPSDRSIIEVSTMIDDGDRSVIRSQPFAHVKMALAANHGIKIDYPKFDPLKIFSSGEEEEVQTASTGVIYGADVESEIQLKVTDFPLDHAPFAYAASLDADEAEEIVRDSELELEDGRMQVAAMKLVDPNDFTGTDGPFSEVLNTTFKVVAENVSVSPVQPSSTESLEYVDDVIAIHSTETIAEALVEAGYKKGQSQYFADFLAGESGTDTVDKGDVIRLGLEQRGDSTRIVRASLYSGNSHRGTVALNDSEILAAAVEPPKSQAVATAFAEQPVAVSSGRDLPRIYDGIFRAALSYGMSEEMTEKLVRMLASSVDFQAKLKPTDTLEALFSVDDENGEADADSELLFIQASFGSNNVRLYRFINPETGAVDYYDSEGRSARQFLLRNPVPNGRFRSGFGMRRHPILGYRRMHTGVDWAAPRGTPIIAAGNGVVEKAGWNKGGYGKQTIIRHPNGYESSYSHQTAIAKGIVPGARVRQGQVIGYVGSTGLSTGPHLHYELIVNGRKVDPMRVRLPEGKSLTGDVLAEFESERERIDRLIQPDSNPARLASAY